MDASAFSCPVQSSAPIIFAPQRILSCSVHPCSMCFSAFS